MKIKLIAKSPLINSTKKVKLSLSLRNPLMNKKKKKK